MPKDNINKSKIDTNTDSTLNNDVFQDKLNEDKENKFHKDENNEVSNMSHDNTQKNDHTKKDNQTEDLKNYEEKISQLIEEKLRLLAEMENLRKRSEKEKIETIKFGNINLARDILSLNDNLTRALENIPKSKNIAKPIKNLVDGLKMIQKEFTTILERHGVKKINALNKKFDHNLHQAMLEVESNKEDGIVVQEIQSGYTMHDKLLRPTMVGVSKKINNFILLQVVIF